jgi:hypothetical protein
MFMSQPHSGAYHQNKLQEQQQDDAGNTQYATRCKGPPALYLKGLG